MRFRQGLAFAAFVVALVVGAAESQAVMFQNTSFDSNMNGWNIGRNTGTWNLQWTSDYGGSVKMYISGAPAYTGIYQQTQDVIRPGDQITVNLYHSTFGNFSDCHLRVDNVNNVVQSSVTSAGSESLTWTADRQYAPGTVFGIESAVWPGSSTTWVKDVRYVPRLSEPGSVSIPEQPTYSTIQDTDQDNLVVVTHGLWSDSEREWVTGMRDAISAHTDDGVWQVPSPFPRLGGEVFTAVSYAWIDRPSAEGGRLEKDWQLTPSLGREPENGPECGADSEYQRRRNPFGKNNLRNRLSSPSGGTFPKTRRILDLGYLPAGQVARPARAWWD